MIQIDWMALLIDAAVKMEIGFIICAAIGWFMLRSKAITQRKLDKLEHEYWLGQCNNGTCKRFSD